MEVDIVHESASDLEISLVSPFGTVSSLTKTRKRTTPKVFLIFLFSFCFSFSLIGVLMIFL